MDNYHIPHGKYMATLMVHLLIDSLEKNQSPWLTRKTPERYEISQFHNNAQNKWPYIEARCSLDNGEQYLEIMVDTTAKWFLFLGSLDQL